MREKILSFIGKKNWKQILTLTALCLTLVLLTGAMDYFTTDMNFFIFYAFLVVFAGLFIGTPPGIAACILSAFLNFYVNQKYLDIKHPVTLYLNLTIDLTFFLFINYMVTLLRKSLLKEKNMARTDYLTGLGNRRFFMEKIKERNTAFNNPFSLCYLDIDHFDAFAEDAGLSRSDEMIQLTAKLIRSKYSEVYRFEENRFMVLFHEIDGQTAFKKMHQLRNNLQLELAKKKLPVTFSVGIILVSRAGFKVSSIIMTLFKLVQSVKQEGGNQIKFAVLK